MSAPAACGAHCSTAVAGLWSRGYRERMRWLGLALAVLLGGCASAFPGEVMRTVDTRISADDLRRDPTAYKGARVIVGGDILSTQPKPGETQIQLLPPRHRDADPPQRGATSPRARLLPSPAVLPPAAR